jgi:hypothetical protein
MRERAAARPEGPAPTISTVEYSGNDIVLRNKNDKVTMTMRWLMHLVFKAIDIIQVTMIHYE